MTYDSRDPYSGVWYDGIYYSYDVEYWENRYLDLVAKGELTPL